MGLFDKLFGTRSEREIKKIRPIVDKILAMEGEYAALSEEALRQVPGLPRLPGLQKRQAFGGADARSLPQVRQRYAQAKV